MPQLTEKDKRTIRMASVLITVYLALFYGLQGWNYLEAQRIELGNLELETQQVRKAIVAERIKAARLEKLRAKFGVKPRQQLGDSELPRHIVPGGLLRKHLSPYRGGSLLQHGAPGQESLQLASERDSLKVVDDQKGAPTSTLELAPALWDVLLSGAAGVYHAACEGEGSWYDFALATFEEADVEIQVEPCTTDEFPRPARRPAYSVLDCSKLTALRTRSLADWREALSTFLGGLG